MSIRNAVPTDVPAMLEIYAYFVLETAVSFEYEVPTQEEFARRLAEDLGVKVNFISTVARVGGKRGSPRLRLRGQAI